MQLLSGALGGGASVGGTSSKTSSTSSSSGSSTPTYTGDQASLQGMLTQLFQQLLPAAGSGGLSPNVQAGVTSGADAINKNYASLGDNLNRQQAARGFGQSGLVGQGQLETELSREGAIGANLASGRNQQMQQNNSLLSDALAFAFANPGQQSSSSGTTSGTSSGSGWGVSVGAGATGAFGG